MPGAPGPQFFRATALIFAAVCSSPRFPGARLLPCGCHRRPTWEEISSKSRNVRRLHSQRRVAPLVLPALSALAKGAKSKGGLFTLRNEGKRGILPRSLMLCGGSVSGYRVISNEAGCCKGFFLRSLLESKTLLRRRTNCVCFWSFRSSPFTLSCSAFCAHRLGVAHQSSLRSPWTTMSFSISPFREAGSLINQPVTFAP